MHFSNSNKINLNEEEIIKALKENDVADEILEILTNFWDNPYGVKIMRKKLNENDIDEKFLKILAQSNDWEIREAVAIHKNTSEEVLQRLSNDEVDYVQSAIYCRKLPSEWGQLIKNFLIEQDIPSLKDLLDNLNKDTVSVDVLEVFAYSPYWQILKTVALHKNVSKKIHEQISIYDGAHSEVVKDAINYRKLPEEWRKMDMVLGNFRESPMSEDNEKLDKLEKDTNLTSNILEIFADSLNSSIRVAVAMHQNTSQEILQKLSKDEDDYVRDKVLFRKLPKEWRELASFQIEARIEKNDVSADILEILAESSSESLRKAVAIHKNTSEEVLQRLSNDEVDDVKDQVLFRKLPDDWRTLASYEKETKLQEDENVPKDILEILAESASSSIKDALLFRKLPADWRILENWEKLEKLEENNDVPSNILEIFASSFDEGLRETAQSIKSSSLDNKSDSSLDNLSLKKVDDPNSKRILLIKGVGFDWSNEYIDEDLYNQLNEEYSENNLDDDFIDEAGFDCESIDCEDSGPSFPPELVLRNEDTLEEIHLNSDKSLEELGVKISGDYPIKEDSLDRNEENSTTQDYRIHRVENFDGVWGAFYLEKGEILDLSKLNIAVERKNCGDLQIDMCFLSYGDQDLDQDVCELGGNYIEWHLSK